MLTIEQIKAHRYGLFQMIKLYICLGIKSIFFMTKNLSNV